MAQKWGTGSPGGFHADRQASRHRNPRQTGTSKQRDPPADEDKDSTEHNWFSKHLLILWILWKVLYITQKFRDRASSVRPWLSQGLYIGMPTVCWCKLPSAQTGIPTRGLLCLLCSVKDMDPFRAGPERSSTEALWSSGYEHWSLVVFLLSCVNLSSLTVLCSVSSFLKWELEQYLPHWFVGLVVLILQRPWKSSRHLSAIEVVAVIISPRNCKN